MAARAPRHPGVRPRSDVEDQACQCPSCHTRPRSPSGSPPRSRRASRRWTPLLSGVCGSCSMVGLLPVNTKDPRTLRAWQLDVSRRLTEGTARSWGAYFEVGCSRQVPWHSRSRGRQRCCAASPRTRARSTRWWSVSTSAPLSTPIRCGSRGRCWSGTGCSCGCRRRRVRWTSATPRTKRCCRCSQRVRRRRCCVPGTGSSPRCGCRPSSRDAISVAGRPTATGLWTLGRTRIGRWRGAVCGSSGLCRTRPSLPP
ncbi:hypothetical protein EDD40_0151 [Saccharothrix texasensis]|uniref:Uncharacterized protein n=1 Tax=Saccharothrix texasensis TaxID=103734 RepID=A0A3N1GY47_9PSEU|nr:hypothetical protein EDD40_0151 [Saccharothrix texasensis]